jgi:hypothetical protein
MRGDDGGQAKGVKGHSADVEHALESLQHAATLLSRHKQAASLGHGHSRASSTQIADLRKALQGLHALVDSVQ